MFRFLILAAVLAAGLPPLISLFYEQGWISRAPSFLYGSTWVVAFITTVIFVYLYRMARPSMFVQFYLLSLVIKLLACLAYTVIIVLKDRSGAVPNAVYLLVVYFIFTTLEISFLYRKISGSGRS